MQVCACTGMAVIHTRVRARTCTRAHTLRRTRAQIGTQKQQWLLCKRVCASTHMHTLTRQHSYNHAKRMGQSLHAPVRQWQPRAPSRAPAPQGRHRAARRTAHASVACACPCRCLQQRRSPRQWSLPSQCCRQESKEEVGRSGCSAGRG